MPLLSSGPLPDGITRRDLVHGLGAACCLPSALAAGAVPAAAPGWQGQTDATLAASHAARDAPASRDGVVELDPETEDLVVVGAGLSGLAGAHWFRQHAGRPVRMLLLDPLQEPGGHAQRNEFVARDGTRLVGYGGSQSLDSPSLFSAATRTLLADLGIDLQRFPTELHDGGWAARHGLTQRALFFERERWGADVLVRHGAQASPADWLPDTPLSPATQAGLAALWGPPRDVLPGLRTRAARRSHLARITYRELLRAHWGVDEGVVRFLAGDTRGYFGVGVDATSALDAWAAGLPGFDGLDLGDGPDPRLSPSGRQMKAGSDSYVYHFPDGNAGVVRALLRSLVPASLPGQGMDALVDTPLDRGQLDRAGAPVRLRMGATALRVRHRGPPASAEWVEVDYVDAAGRRRRVRARQVLLACWHRVVARLTDELPAAQVRALDDQVKVPLVYATVLLSNWRAWQRAGVRSLSPVDGFWGDVSLDFPMRLGSQRPPESPDSPILLHLGKVVVPGNGQPARQQAAQGRAELMSWSFADVEARIHRLLSAALGPFGFDGARDIEAITLNRWAHGYAYEYMRPWDRFWPRGPLPCELARRGWGRVAIANSDAGAYAYAHGAIDQAARAVQALLPHARLPAGHPMPGPDPRQIGLA
ncbi:NAD(P)-binding protein [Ideonella sp.]|uniref:NAD(P)-binding protein n=1 Tax=Ideonella sp. TaxID=1929293 RepID=UPI0035B2D8F1